VDVNLIGTGFLLLGVVVWAVCVVLAYRNAPRFGRSAIGWAALAVVFGPFALFALYLLPRGHATGGGKKHEDPRAALYEVPRKKD
jgi:hypothetical protein